MTMPGIATPGIAGESAIESNDKQIPRPSLPKEVFLQDGLEMTGNFEPAC